MTPIAFQHIEPKGGSDKKRYSRKLLPPDKEFLSAREENRIMGKVGGINKKIRQFNSICTRLIDENAAGRGTVEWFARNEQSLPELTRKYARFLVRSYEAQLTEFVPKRNLIDILASSIDGKTAGQLAKTPQLLIETEAALKEGIHIGSICLGLKNKVEEIVCAQAQISAPN